jgi:hypothetical protein
VTIKGYPDQAKTADGATHFATVGPVREQQYALDVIAHVYHYSVGTDAAEAGSTARVIVATSHAARKGDVIRYTSGTLDNREYRVAATATNSITLAEAAAAAPSAADTFQILRPKAAVVNDDGTLAVSFNAAYDGEPGDPIPSEAILIGGSDSGTLRAVAVDASGNVQVDVVASALPSGAATLAEQQTQTTHLAAIETAVEGTLTVQATNLDIRDLTSASDSVAAVQSGTWTVDLDAAATVSVENLPTTVDTNAGAPGASTPRVAVAAANLAYYSKGKIAGSSLTGSYATLLDPTADLRILAFLNSCNDTILVSLDGGTTDSLELEAGESITLDLGQNGLKFSSAVNISAKHNGAAPTAGSIRVTGIG